MLDLKNWFNPKHYKRLWNVGPPGLIMSLLLIYLTLQYEAEFNIRKYETGHIWICLLYTSPSPRDVEESRMPSSA